MKAVIIAAVILLSGCSATSALTGLISDKPDVTAQVGAENSKVGVGLTGKVDSSSSAKAELKNSKVDTLDSSSGKKTSDNSIKASTITAEKIEITNNDSSAIPWVGSGIMLCIIIVLLLIIFRKNRKAP